MKEHKTGHSHHHEHGKHAHHTSHSEGHDEHRAHQKGHDGHDKHASHAGGHGGHGGHGAHADHTGHEEMFRQRFWVSLVLTIPVLLYSPMLQESPKGRRSALVWLLDADVSRLRVDWSALFGHYLCLWGLALPSDGGS